MNEIYLATKNSGKIREFSEILDGIKPLLDFDEVEETGTSFIENACIKAASIGRKINKCVLADDSGLSVYALDFRPGVYSARYGGPGLSSRERSQLILDEMKGETDRRARFTAALALYLPDGRIITAAGLLEGEIIHEHRGTNGFGYDPIFRPVGFDKTLAELDGETKNGISHRRAAVNKMKAELAKL